MKIKIKLLYLGRKGYNNYSKIVHNYRVIESEHKHMVGESQLYTKKLKGFGIGSIFEAQYDTEKESIGGYKFIEFDKSELTQAARTTDRAEYDAVKARKFSMKDIPEKRYINAINELKKLLADTPAVSQKYLRYRIIDDINNHRLLT